MEHADVIEYLHPSLNTLVVCSVFFTLLIVSAVRRASGVVGLDGKNAGVGGGDILCVEILQVALFLKELRIVFIRDLID
ncbi:MAG: hypothetical protein IJC50_08590, partial [Clostridia bacterium]|nr:hypothetical protein [Clostridia bacterium]